MAEIKVNLDKVLAERKISSKELAQIVGITQANLSILKSSKARGICFATLLAICEALDCQPGDILSYSKEV